MKFTKTYPKIVFLIAISLSFATLVSCSSSPKNTESLPEQDGPRTSYTEEAESRAITNAAAVEVGAHSFVEIQFQPGSSTLTKASKTSLNKLMSQAREDGKKIDEVMVMSWADQEFPSKNIKKLPAPQMRLAEKRNQVLKNYIKATQPVSVESYNMAEQPSAFEKIFNTTDSKLKNSFVAAGLPTTADDPQYPSKASHAVILVKVK